MAAPNFGITPPAFMNQSTSQDWQTPNFGDLFKAKFGNQGGSMDMSMNPQQQTGSGFISTIPDVPTAPPFKDQTWSQRLFGGQDNYGNKWGGMAAPALQFAQTGLNAYLGFKQLGQAEDALNFQKDAFSKQFENQQTLTNAQLRDRQKARVAFNPNAQSVDSYMKENGV